MHEWYMFSELSYLLIVVFKVKGQDPHAFRKKFQLQIIYLNLSVFYLFLVTQLVHIQL